MKLKYYLRGLGLGLIVAALILGVRHVRSSNGTVSDAEIRKRAMEMGMVDASSVTAYDDIESTEEMLADIEDSEDGSVDIETIANDFLEENDSDVQDNDVTDDTSTADVSGSSEEETVLEDTTSEITTDAADDPGLDYPTEDDSFFVAAPETGTDETSSDTGNENASPADQASVSDGDGSAAAAGGSFTISSGDSSDRVARKLADAGYVASASEFDAYLCAHGYDRVISTGNYTITEGMSYEDIARLITHR